ncbi:hypothetical protein [Faecalimonas sp.]
MRKSTKKLFSITVILFLSICTPFVFSICSHAEEEQDISNIIGGIKIIDGKQYKMSHKEAQAEFLAEEKSRQSSPMEELFADKNFFSPRVITQTKVTSQSLVTGTNEKFSASYVNNTSSNIIKEVIGSSKKTVKLESGVNVDLSNIVSKANADFKITASVSISKTVKDKITIKPGKTFYMTFTPKYYKIKGKQYLLLSHGQGIWKDFVVKAPKRAGTELDGTVYYIEK